MGRQCRHDLPELVGRNWLVNGIEESEQSRPPRQSSAGCVDAMLPVVVYVSVALTAPIGKGITEELVKDRQEAMNRRQSADLLALLTPPDRESRRQTDFRFAHDSERTPTVILPGGE